MKQRGFVFIELVMVLGVLATLLSIVIINIGNVRSSASVNTIVESFITDLKNQQTKAMVGDTEGRGVPDTYSLYLQTASYTLFHGQNYVSTDSANFTVPIESSFQVSTTFAGNKIIFASRSGEILNFVSGKDTVVIKNARTAEQKSIKLDKYGSIISVN